MADDRNQFLNYLKAHLAEVDFALAVFAAAVSSYKCESLVKPFPPMYILNNGEKDITSLREAVGSIPCLRSVNSGEVSLTPTQYDLLQWVVNCHRTNISCVKLDKLLELRRLTGEHTALPEPQYLYELKYDEQREAAFTDKSADKKLIYAYHGSKPENFYSILHHGLHAHMNKTSLYGEGTYLAVEPTVAMGFSPWGLTGWSNSTIGNNLSVIALCEVIDHPSVVHKLDKEAASNNVRAPNSQGGDIPDKYIVVTNNDMVRVKYLLVYAKNTTSAANKRYMKAKRHVSAIQWIHNHSQVLLPLFYIILLLFIGLMSSPRFWTQVQKFYEQAFDSWGWSGDSPL